MNGGDNGQDGPAQHVRPVLRITPEPTEEEMAAIAAALLALSRAPDADDDTPPQDHWRSAGRQEALRSPLRR